MYKLFVSEPAMSKKEVITLCYMVKDNHCYPILNDEIVRKYSKHCKNPINTELKYVDMSDRVFLEGVDLSILGEGDLLLVDNVEEKFVELVNKDKYQPLYFDFDAQNKLECFVHHKGYMVSRKVDYETKKEICSKMGEHIEQFKLRNKSITNLANNILKLRYGQIIKSVYNVDCFKLVDKFKPNAVVRNFGYYCDRPEEYREGFCGVDYKSIEERGEPKCFHICKCYSSVLLENKNVKPIYTIHDKIEEYDGSEIVCTESTL